MEGETQQTRKKIRRKEFMKKMHIPNKMCLHGEGVMTFL